MLNSLRFRSAGSLLVLAALLVPSVGNAATKHIKHYKAHRTTAHVRHAQDKPAARPPVPETEADRVRALIAGGARGLAVHVIDRQQSRPSISKDDWMKWERLRVRAYKAAGSWKALAARADALIPGLPRTFVNWLVTEAAEADLRARDGAHARRLLRRLLWQGGKTHSAERARWRRLVIRSYLTDDQVDDARTALLRYMQDFPVQGGEWTVLRATVLLRTHRPVEAFRALVGADTDSAKLLRLYAGLRIHAYKMATVIHQATHLAQSSHLDPTVRRKAWILLAQAAQRARDAHLRALALEHALVLPPRTDILTPFFPISADDLWKAYDRLAEKRGNRDRLLVGNDAPWLREARAASKKDPVLSRALYAFLATHAASAKVRAESHRRLADSLYDAGGTLAVTALYMSSTRFPSLQSVPTSIRVRLVNEALKVHNIKMAARLMKDFAQPPRGEDADQWVLRRARTLIYGGDPASAVDLLNTLLKSRKQFSTKLGRRTTQVLFDLQAVDDHKQAVRLLHELYDRVSDLELRRELLYWMADSRSALGQHQDAAELYLRSAAMGPQGNKDLWAQSARYHAAQALADAGLIDDAHNVYAALLRITRDPDQRALIQRKMQQLWLKKRATTQSSRLPSAASVSAPTAAQ
jgi:tetratricopeptide (TPR) repeat protein